MVEWVGVSFCYLVKRMDDAMDRLVRHGQEVLHGKRGSQEWTCESDYGVVEGVVRSGL
jgi:hypothetical protein